MVTYLHTPELEQLAANRIAMSHFKYGDVNDMSWDNEDPPSIIIKHIKEYEKDGNLEHIADALNFIKIEWFLMHKAPREGVHFTATDSDKSLGCK